MADPESKPISDLVSRASHVGRLKQKLDRLRSEVSVTACELKSAAEEFEKACPHDKIVECGDGMLGPCICDYGIAHPARLCELCGAYEFQCPQTFDGYVVLHGGAVRGIPLAEFMNLHNALLWQRT